MIPQPLPRIAEFEKLAYGMFIHWGLYSQLGRGEWVKKADETPAAQYAELIKTFTASEFDADAIARLAQEAGMRYICLTTRHHEGFSLFDTRGLSDFDAVHSPAKRDLVAEFVIACRKHQIVPFLYHTTLDWFQPSFENDFDAYLDYLRKSVEILCTQYGPIGGLWFDGNWSKPDADWQEDRMYAVIRRHQPDAIIVNNTGLKARGAVGNTEIDSVTFEQGRPEPMNREGMPKYLAAEMCQTMNRHWAVATDDFCYKSPKDIIESLCACRKVGANYLLNVGPTAAGKIPAYETAALLKVGQWIGCHAEALYNVRPLATKTAAPDFVLQSDGVMFFFIHNLASGGHSDVTVGLGGAGPRAFSGVPHTVKQIHWMDNGEPLKFVQDGPLLCMDATAYPYGKNWVVRIARAEW